MKKRLILTASALVSIAVASAQDINSPGADGYIRRAAEMYEDENYIGCLDQLRRAGQLNLSATDAERAAFYRMLASVHTDKTQAERLALDFLATYPASEYRFRATMALADCYYGSDYARAAEIYSEINPATLPYSDALTRDYRLGYCCLQTGDLKRADECFSALADSKTYGNASRFYRGYIAYVRRDYTRAEQLLSYVDTSTAPGNMADYYLCQIYFVSGDYAKAISRAKSVLRHGDAPDQYRAEALRVAGESEWNLGNEAEAVSYLNKYIRLTDAPLPSSLYILGINDYNQADYDIAISRLQAATDLEDAMAQSAYLYIGQAQLKQRDYHAAALAFNKALSLDFDPDVTEAAYYNYAVASLQGGQVPFGSSVSIFQDFLSRYPDSRHAPEVQEYIVSSLITDNNYAAALDCINKMRSPSRATLAAKQRVLYTLGARALAAGNTDTALTHLKEARSLASHSAEIDREVSLCLGEAYYRSAQYDQAASELLKYLKSTSAPNRATALYDLGYTRFKQKRYSDAATDFNRMIDNPGNMPRNAVADAWCRIADCHYYAGDFAKAADAYDRAYSLNPDAGDYALFQKGVMEGYQRNHTAKIALLKELQQKYTTSALIPDAMLEMTESYIQQGNHTAAIDTYRTLIARYPNTAQGRQGHLQMALTMLNSGDPAGATKAYREVISKYPTSTEATLALEQLKRISAADGSLDSLMDFVNSVPDAPRMEVAEADNLSFELAEKDYITEDKTNRLSDYIARYPDGANRAKALAYMAEHAFNAGDNDRAYEYAAEIVERYPDNSLTEDALLIKAQVEMSQGKGNSAMRSWQELAARASSPAKANAARMGLMRVARELNDDEQIIAAADALLASSTIGSEDKNEAVFSKALALSRQGNAADARSLWETITSETDDLSGIKSAYYLAESLYNDGLNAQAEEKASAITASDSPHTYWIARAFILLSDIYAKQGDEFKSKQYLKALRENYPGTESDIFMMIDQRLK